MQCTHVRSSLFRFWLQWLFFFLIWETILDPCPLHSYVAWDTFSSAIAWSTPNSTGWRVPLPGSPVRLDLFQVDGLVFVSWRLGFSESPRCSLACLRATHSPLSVCTVWGRRVLANLVSFRDFLRRIELSLSFLKSFPYRIVSIWKETATQE